MKIKKYIKKYFKYQFHNPKKFWNEFGGQKYFDQFHGIDLRNEYIFLEYIAQYQPKTIIDIGCGYGRYLKVINEVYPEIKLCGVDIAESQITQAKLFLKECNNISLSMNEQNSLPFPDKSFDMAITYGCLSAVKKNKLNQFFSEICRITKSIGVFIESCPNKKRNIKSNNYYWYKHDYTALFSELIYKQRTLNEIDDTLFVVEF